MRATIDLDDPSELAVERAFHKLKQYGDGQVYGRVSSSGSGVHLKVHGCDPDNVDEARRLCGDDEKRRQFDRNSELKPQQILFSSKPDAEGASEWTTDVDAVLSEYRRRCPVETRHPGVTAPEARRW